MLERSKALEASERSIAASILRGLLCKVLFALLGPFFNSEDPNARSKLSCQFVEKLLLNKSESGSE
jgi:hypothetical protein